MTDSKNDSRPRAAIVGFFDGVHLGHRSLARYVMERARERGLKPAAVTFSCCPLEILRPGSEPGLLSEASWRIAEMERCLGPESVITLDFDRALAALTAEEFMTMLHDDYNVRLLVVGFNNKFGSDRGTTFDDYKTIGMKIGMEVIHAPEYDAIKGVSSSATRRALAGGDVALAAKMLGRFYSIDGHVGSGRKVGRTIGFPTANVSQDNTRIIVPAPGVYCARATTAGGDVYPAMVNIGVCPTVTDGRMQTIEANLIGFEGNLYGQPLRLEFVDRIRDEKRFDSIDSLRRQLEMDRRKVSEVFMSASVTTGN